VAFPSSIPPLVPPRRSKLPWILGGVAAFVVLVLCVGAVAAGALWLHSRKGPTSSSTTGDSGLKPSVGSAASRMPGPKGNYGVVADICAVIDYTTVKGLGVAILSEPPVSRTDDYPDLPQAHYREMSCSAGLAEQPGAPLVVMTVHVNAKVFFDTVLGGYAYDENRPVLDGENQASNEFDSAKKTQLDKHLPGASNVTVTGLGTRAYLLVHHRDRRLR
jgi:hypothetical protein